MQQSASQLDARIRWSGLCLGIGLGGFFDGILLHQILQWHHLLSGLETAGRDIAFLIMTDGLFHLLMYLITLAGLVLLWRTRRGLSAPGAGRALAARGLIGFGTWHIIDAILSHWVLGIHRVRMDVDQPLLWDLAWFILFGLVPVIFGVLLTRRSGGGPAGAVPAALVLLCLLAGAVASLPIPGQTAKLVLFRGGLSPQEVFAALGRIEARAIWSDPTGRLWAVDTPAGQSMIPLYFEGALLVSQSPVIAGCLTAFVISEN